jgi:ABC-type multidrug transport system ATPase subunit
MNAIVIDSVSKSFRQHPFWFWRTRKQTDDVLAIADISLCVPSGTVQVLLGPNGSGKTTLLKLVSTMLLPDQGTLLVDGFNTTREEQKVRRRVGFTVANERSFFPRLTARENLNFFAAFDEVPGCERDCRVSNLLQAVGLSEEGGKLVMNFSTGMYQRLGIARALLKSPSILLLDEPSRSLDPGSAMHLCRLIQRLANQGTTVLIASHNFQETVALADRVAVLCEGHLQGECRVVETDTAETLREFYFDCVGDQGNDSDAVFDIPVARALAG